MRDGPIDDRPSQHFILQVTTVTEPVDVQLEKLSLEELRDFESRAARMMEAERTELESMRQQLDALRLEHQELRARLTALNQDRIARTRRIRGISGLQRAIASEIGKRRG